MNARDRLLLWCAEQVLHRLVLGSLRDGAQDGRAGRILMSEARAEAEAEARQTEQGRG